MALKPGQYQIGSLVMGPGTLFGVAAVAVGYDVNSQDYQKPLVDGINFRQDSMKPSPLQLSINVLINRARTAKGNNAMGVGGPSLATLVAEWDAPETRLTWGMTKPLLFCDDQGNQRQWAGRPGKLTYQPNSLRHPTMIQVTAEYRRADMYSYSQGVTTATILTSGSVSIDRTAAMVPTPLSITLGRGPAPTVTVGSARIKFSRDIPAGRTVTISSYPWEQTVLSPVDGEPPETWAGFLEHDDLHTPFVSDLMLPPGQTSLVSSSVAATISYQDRGYGL